jgi:hypothetical protein
LERGFDLTLHTIEAEPRDVLTKHSVGAATKGGVLEKALQTTHNRLLPQIKAELTRDTDPAWEQRFADLVTQTCQVVRDHENTLTY